MEAEISKSFVGSLLWKIERLAKPLLRAFGQNSEPPSIYEEDLEPLRRMLARIRASLRDSESRKIEDELHKLWVCELRELECSAEDIIEELEFQALAKQKLTEFQSQLRTMTGSTSDKILIST